MRHLRCLSLFGIVVFPALAGTALVTNTATCSGVITTGGATCSGLLVYADASGSLTQAGNTLNISASAFSSYSYAPTAPQPASVPARAETLISGDFATDGPLRDGFAEITFNDLFIRQNNIDSTWAQFTIFVNGVKVYSCFSPGGGLSQCPTSALSIPIQLGSDFTLQVDDVSSSPAASFSGGISADLSVSLFEAQSSLPSNLADAANVPEPCAAGLVFAGLCVLLVKRPNSRIVQWWRR